MVVKSSQLKVPLNEKKTLEAREILRQRQTSDGLTEYLIRWSVCSDEVSNSIDVASTSTNNSEDAKHGKDVFLWMSKHALQTCCPHLYTTEPQPKPNDGNSSSFAPGSKKMEEEEQPQLDMEELDDMRYDVVKLVNRARKQMNRVRKDAVSKPLLSLSHTIKVLSTYATLGSLSEVFRETGALDLILDLLWTDDADTRRSAGRMLRALALHDAGSRAYVLLSLTQDSSEENHGDRKKHYADFENRDMVMEMFAETASGEEAHAVQLDSLQLPQVPGKALFTLMKCYLRVTSLMDTTNADQSKSRCTWMVLGDTVNHTQTKRFEVAMAISDLINELNCIMDWNNNEKWSAAQAKSKTEEKQLNSLANIKVDRNAMKQRIKQQQLNEKKHLFPHASQQSIDPALLSSLLKSEQPKPMYRHPGTFVTRRQYAEYVQSKIKPGFRVRACHTYQDVTEGDEGIYRQHNDSTPPVQVFWHRLNRPFWVHWHHMQLIGDSKRDFKEPPPFVTDPENSLLWPQLSGMKMREGSMYGISPNKINTTETKHDVSTQDWWLLLFYADKLTKEVKQNIKVFISLKYPTASHLSLLEPDFETALFVVAEILKQCSVKDKASLCCLATVKVLVDTIEENMQSSIDKQTPPEVQEEKSEEISSINEDTVVEVEEQEQKKEPVSNAPSKPRNSESYKPAKYARAVEMGLRISLIEDEATEELYGQMLMVEENYELAAKVWKMQQDGEKLSTISNAFIMKNSAAKIIVMTVLRNIAARTDVGVDSRKYEVEDMLRDLNIAVQDENSNVMNVYLYLVSALIKHHPPTSVFASSDTDGISMLLATSGHLKCTFDIISKFQSEKEILHLAIHCICSIMGARSYAQNPTKTKSVYKNLISAIITSIASSNPTTGPSTSTDKDTDTGSLHCFITVFESHIGIVMEEFKKKEPVTSKFNDIDSPSNITTLYEILCILCMIMRLDHSKSMVSENDTILTVIGKATKVIPAGNPIRDMLLRLRGLTISCSHADFLEMSDNQPSDDPLEGFAFGTFHLSDLKNNKSLETLPGGISNIRSLSPSDVETTVNSFVSDQVLPILRITPATPGQGKWVKILRNFFQETESISDNVAPLLAEAHWSEVVSCLHRLLEACSTSPDPFGSDTKEVAEDIVAVLYQLADLDKDFAVELCSLDAKQTINRLLDKHTSIPKTVELRDLIGSCEKQRILHNKLLAVVLGGCISTALQCVEEARNRCSDINIPLFSQLLENLCKGADVEMKEERCWERLEASTNQRHVLKLTDGNPKTYWESNGSSGGHWINVYIKKGVIIRKMTVTVAQEDSSYMPSRIVVLGGTSPLDVSTQLSCINVMSSDREVVLLENMKKFWPMVRISVRRCQQGGIDTRLHCLEVVGPKPSFWPILRRQLYVRTSLSYSVQAHVWATEACRGNPEDLKQHQILDVPDKLIAAIKYEQGFADNFLPNSECATVLGQACRVALSSPVFSVLLKTEGEEKKSLLHNLLRAYVTADKDEDRVFTLKMRKLCRFLMDLDAGIPSPASSKAPASGSKENSSAWSRKVQPRSGKSDGSGSGRVMTPNYSGSGRGRSKEDLSSINFVDEDAFHHSSHLPEVASCWASIVCSQFFKIVKNSFSNLQEPLQPSECFELVEKILSKYKFLQQSMKNIFGPKSHVSVMLATGIWRSFISLTLETSVRLSYVLSCVINTIIEKYSFKSRSDLLRLKEVLPISSGTDFCHTFEHLYSLFMMERLIRDPPCLEVEEECCGYLLPCFPKHQPSDLLQDAVYSNQLHERFISKTLEEHDIDGKNRDQKWSQYLFLLDGGFRTLIFRQNVTSFSAIQKGVVGKYLSKLDCRLYSLMHSFERFYRGQREESCLRLTASSNQTIKWTGEGYAVVLDTLTNKEIRVTTVQMILLLHFNENKVVDLKDWKLAFPNQWKVALDSLLMKKVVREVGDGKFVCEEVLEDLDCSPDVYAPIRSLWSESEKIKQHHDRRSSIIDCKIVKMMKQKTECLSDQIIEEVLRESIEEEDGFIPQVEHIQARCEHLINLGYLTRISRRSIRYNIDSSKQNDSNSDENVPEEKPGPSSQIITSLDNAIITTSSTVVAVQVKPFTSVVNPSAGQSTYLTTARPLKAWEGETEVSVLPNLPIHSNTLTSNQVITELRTEISRLAEILSQSVETAEALLLQFDWHSDKLIESYAVARETTLASVGISENSPQKSPEIGSMSCPVCMNALEEGDCVSPICGHLCCKTCWRSYLEMQLSLDKSSTTTCPLNDCTVRPTLSLYRFVFGDDSKNVDKYELGLVRSYVDSNKQRSWCHNPRGCDRIVQNSGNDVGWCNACGWQTCFACTYVEAHSPASCGHMSQWMDDGGFYEGMNEDARSKHLARLIAKRCPNCQANIEKNDGCLHMKCAKCTHDFCWRCLQPWRPSHRDYYNCGTKVSKLAQAGVKFVEFNKRCRFHHKAKQFAFDLRRRLLSINDSPSPANLQLCLNMCTKLADFRKILAYCNVFQYYSVDSEKLDPIGLYSVALENKTLALQEHIGNVLLSCADIQHTVATVKQTDLIKGQRLMNDCEDTVKRLTTFAKQDMKVALPSSTNQTIKVTDSGTVVVTNDEDNTTFGANSRPAGDSQDEDSLLLDPVPSYFTSDDDQDEGNLASDDDYEYDQSDDDIFSSSQAMQESDDLEYDDDDEDDDGSDAWLDFYA
ncbi:cullin-9-like [Ciona intestinalis]